VYVNNVSERGRKKIYLKMAKKGQKFDHLEVKEKKVVEISVI